MDSDIVLMCTIYVFRVNKSSFILQINFIISIPKIYVKYIDNFFESKTKIKSLT